MPEREKRFSRTFALSAMVSKLMVPAQISQVLLEVFQHRKRVSLIQVHWRTLVTRNGLPLLSTNTWNHQLTTLQVMPWPLLVSQTQVTERTSLHISNQSHEESTIWFWDCWLSNQLFKTRPYDSKHKPSLTLVIRHIEQSNFGLLRLHLTILSTQPAHHTIPQMTWLLRLPCQCDYW